MRHFSQLQKVKPHAFIDKTNILLYTVAIVLMIADLTQTRIKLNTGLYHEDNPLARPLMNAGIGGTIAAGIIAVTMRIVYSWIAHKTGHHKLERFVPVLSMILSVIALIYGHMHRLP
jgi:hypothetical protein